MYKSLIISFYRLYNWCYFCVLHAENFKKLKNDKTKPKILPLLHSSIFPSFWMKSPKIYRQVQKISHSYLLYRWCSCIYQLFRGTCQIFGGVTTSIHISKISYPVSDLAESFLYSSYSYIFPLLILFIFLCSSY